MDKTITITEQQLLEMFDSAVESWGFNGEQSTWPDEEMPLGFVTDTVSSLFDSAKTKDSETEGFTEKERAILAETKVRVLRRTLKDIVVSTDDQYVASIASGSLAATNQ